jgi:hypothetical protein
VIDLSLQSSILKELSQVSLGDIALLLATIVTSKGPHGLSDAARGQLFTITGESAELLPLNTELTLVVYRPDDDGWTRARRSCQPSVWLQVDLSVYH